LLLNGADGNVTLELVSWSCMLDRQDKRLSRLDNIVLRSSRLNWGVVEVINRVGLVGTWCRGSVFSQRHCLSGVSNRAMRSVLSKGKCLSGMGDRAGSSRSESYSLLRRHLFVGRDTLETVRVIIVVGRCGKSDDAGESGGGSSVEVLGLVRLTVRRSS